MNIALPRTILLEEFDSGTLFIDEGSMAYLSRGHFFSDYSNIEEACRNFYDSIFGWRSDVPHFSSMSPTLAVNALIQRVNLVVISKQRVATSAVGEAASQRMYSARNIDGDLTLDDVQQLVNDGQIGRRDLIREIEVDDLGNQKVKSTWRPAGEMFPDMFNTQSSGLLTVPSLATTGESLNTFEAYIHKVPPRLSIQGSELFEAYFEPKLQDKVSVYRVIGGSSIQSINYQKFSRRPGGLS